MRRRRRRGARSGVGGDRDPDGGRGTREALPRSTEAKIADFAFSPADIEVEVGDKITWTNDDADAHTVTATSGADFDSGTLAQGADFTFEAKKAGTIAYFCAIHPSMKGTITVR